MSALGRLRPDGPAGAGFPHELRHVVSGVDVADRPRDIGGPLAPVGRAQDGCLEPLRRFLVARGGVFEFLRHHRVHALHRAMCAFSGQDTTRRKHHAYL